jgi:hypothetical protein
MMSLRIVVAISVFLFARITEAKLEGHGSGRDLGSSCEDYEKFYDRCCEDKDGTGGSKADKCDWGFITGLPDPDKDYPNCCCPVRNSVAQSKWDKKCEEIKTDCEF